MAPVFSVKVSLSKTAPSDLKIKDGLSRAGRRKVPPLYAVALLMNDVGKNQISPTW